jgi:hypothetical protein
MRALLPTVALLAAACTTTFAEPRFQLSPYVAVHRLRGDAGAATPGTGGGPATANAPQPLSRFGQGERGDDLCWRFDVGDGFAGARVDWYRLGIDGDDGSALGDGYGAFAAGDVATMRARMEEFRVGYIESVASTRLSLQDRPLTLRVGAGAVLASRDLSLTARRATDGAAERSSFDGENPYAALRLGARWRDVALDAEYALCPGLAIGGDVDGVLHDLELRAAWTLPYYDVTLFAGWRLATIEAAAAGGRTADLTLDGWLLGVSVSF